MGEIKSIEELANFCKRRGFVYRSGEIYGGLAGFWDFAPLGLALKQNIKREWWGFHVDEREEVLGIDGAIITNPKVWEASGHVQGFVELAVKCKKCGFKFKLEKSEANAAKCEKCGGEVEVLGEFNAMFKTKVGPLESDSVTAYLRPETAQSIFVNFKFLFENFRMRLPCGVAQIGKAFRNELSPREFLFRSREFEQMELEYFIHPSSECEWMGEIKGIKVRVLTANEQNSGKGKELGKEMELFSAWKEGVIKNSWHAYWIAKELEWFSSLGANLKNFRVRQHTAKERSHYSSDTWDIEYNFPMGWRELQGFANRGDFDLSQHEKFSGKSLEVNDPKHGKVLPHVVCEPSLGVERAFLVFMLESLSFDKARDNFVLKLSPKLAPVKVAVFPIVKNDQSAVKFAREIFKGLKKEFGAVVYDESGSIGRRYARNDEIGTPFCVTIDAQSLEDKSVTIRERDSTHQVRVSSEELAPKLSQLLNQEIEFERAGKRVR